MTCRAILGLLNSSAFQVNGEIFFDNRSLLQLKEKERALYYGNKIAFIPQNPMTALDPSRKIGAQMAEFLNLHQDLKKKEALSLYEQAPFLILFPLVFLHTGNRTIRTAF